MDAAEVVDAGVGVGMMITDGDIGATAITTGQDVIAARTVVIA